MKRSEKSTELTLVPLNVSTDQQSPLLLIPHVKLTALGIVPLKMSNRIPQAPLIHVLSANLFAHFKQYPFSCQSDSPRANPPDLSEISTVGYHHHTARATWPWHH